MANHFPASQWRTWIDQCQQSDLTVASFCESIGVSVNTYYRWRQRLQNEQPVAEPPLVFVPVALPVAQVEIELPNGAIARVHNDANSLRPLPTLLLEKEGTTKCLSQSDCAPPAASQCISSAGRRAVRWIISHLLLKRSFIAEPSTLARPSTTKPSF